MPLLTGWGESLRIVDAPTQLPCDTVLGAYSPPLCFEYSGLQMGQQYTLKIWLLSVGSWNCASSQWCERQFILDNTDGTQQAGVIQLAENMDVYDYSLFDWVLRLYDAQGNEEAFTERYTEGTTNRPPVLASIGHRQGRVGEQIEFTLSASDPEGNVISFMAQPLPAEATLNTNSGVFCWTPSVTGRYVVCFSATECEAAGLQDGELVEFLIRTGPVITAQPQSQTVPRGTSVMFSVETSDPGPLTYQWQFNGQDIPDATEASWPIQATQMSNAGIYRVLLSNAEGISVSEEAVLTVFIDRTATQAVEAGIEHLRREMDLYHNRFPVYDDISSGGNHFHARGQLPDQFSAVSINGSWTNNPHSGATCIRCVFNRMDDNYGGFYFMNGILVGPAPLPYFGGTTVPGTNITVTHSTGLDLSGATSLTFWARGEIGGERVEFFLGGVGWEPETELPIEPYPDSTARYPPLWTTFLLSNQWQRFSINLNGLNLTNIMGGFGWVASASDNPNGAIFYVDDINYELNGVRLEQRLNEPRFIRSFVTKPFQPDIHDGNPDDDIDFALRNTAYVYDNALAVIAFLAHGSLDSLRRARLIGDAMVYAAQHDRTYTDGRLRTAYAAGDIALPPGWEVDGKSGTVTIPGFYEEAPLTFFEVENRDVDTGNNAWGMIALLALYKQFQEPTYLEAARRIGAFIQLFQDNEGVYRGYRGGIREAEGAFSVLRSYASTEHNLDVYAAFRMMGCVLGDGSWDNLAEHARQFVETMWDEAGGCYRTGTLEEDPDSRNETPGQLPLDTHSWSLLALPQILLLHPHLLECPEQHHRVTRDGFSGFDFNEDKDGVWLEGTAQMAVAYAAEGHTNAAEELCAILRAAQQLPAPIGNGLGTVAAVRDGMSTGFGFKLFRRLHLGATAWNVLAQLRGNPYYQTRTPSQFPCLRMKLPHVEENRILCQFPVQGGLTYRVEFRESLDAGGWQPLTTVHTLDGMIETGITSPITGPRCFYRVVEEHEPQ